MVFTKLLEGETPEEIDDLINNYLRLGNCTITGTYGLNGKHYCRIVHSNGAGTNGDKNLEYLANLPSRTEARESDWITALEFIKRDDRESAAEILNFDVDYMACVIRNAILKEDIPNKTRGDYNNLGLKIVSLKKLIKNFARDSYSQHGKKKTANYLGISINEFNERVNDIICKN
ncbi:hypothetical protein HOK51_07425 [Candidatus Woesearchaeota archaeon]|jgi:hypothetical protein|nr:hypothetical protein [Candidatus Woesearchaeota archaeon]MBT6519653.1 hypothetical protein [Candidatus Woesearchaeota archaeon]MBT7368701.1 hypothetical protein [Candidatus Woesearchaeota archaeon]